MASTSLYILMNQVDLEECALASLAVTGEHGFKALPKDFGRAVFSVSAHRSMFEKIKSLAADGICGTKEMSSRMGELQAEFDHLVANVPLDLRHDLDDLRQAAFELEARTKVSSLSGLEKTQESVWDKLLKSPERTMIYPAQDFANGIMYFTVKVGDTLALLTSKRDLFEFKECSKHGLMLASNDVSMARMSREAIVSFREKETDIKPSVLFDLIRTYIGRFVFLKDPNACS